MQSASVDKGIWVSGTGVAHGPRDECVIGAGVEVRRGNAVAVLADSAAALEAMREVALGSVAGPADLETSAVSLNPVYDNYPTLAGFTAAISLRLRTKDIDGVGQLLGRLVAAGGDEARLHEVSFGHADPAALITAARDAAWADALAKGRQLAGLAGRELGEVLAIAEYSGSEPPRPRGRMMMAMADAGGPSLDAGEGQVSVTLSVGWALR